MTEFTVEQDWRDRGGSDRPDINNISFQVNQNNTEYISGTGTSIEDNANLYVYNVSSGGLSYQTYLETEVKDSNTYLYHYTVPEQDSSGTAYSYSSEQEYIFNKQNYIDETTTEMQENNQYLAVGLTDFTFTMNWADAYDNSARPIINVDFIKNNFKLYNKNTNTLITLPDSLLEGETWEDYVSVTSSGNITTVTIKRLEYINSSGTANEYYLALNNSEMKLAVNSEFKSQDDYYAVKSENLGLHIHETDKTYNNGEINLLLTGTTNFTGNVVWKYKETESIRQNDNNAATFALWRYSGDDSEYSAKYKDPFTLNGTADTFSFPNLDKYDIKGQLYTYYAVESVSVEKTEGNPPKTYQLPYQIIYQDNAAKKLFNNQTVTNKLSDEVEYTVSAEWIAAARQGGTASATYQLQRKLEDDSDWENVESITLTFDELHMSRSGDDTCKFQKIDMYNSDGELYNYRVVQTSVTRTDQLANTNTPVTDTTEIGGDTHPTGSEITVNDKYDVKLTRNGTDFHFQYLIKGDTLVNIEKYG